MLALSRRAPVLQAAPEDRSDPRAAPLPSPRGLTDHAVAELVEQTLDNDGLAAAVSLVVEHYGMPRPSGLVRWQTVIDRGGWERVRGSWDPVSRAVTIGLTVVPALVIGDPYDPFASSSVLYRKFVNQVWQGLLWAQLLLDQRPDSGGDVEALPAAVRFEVLYHGMFPAGSIPGPEPAFSHGFDIDTRSRAALDAFDAIPESNRTAEQHARHHRIVDWALRAYWNEHCARLKATVPWTPLPPSRLSRRDLLSTSVSNTASALYDRLPVNQPISKELRGFYEDLSYNRWCAKLR